MFRNRARFCWVIVLWNNLEIYRLINTVRINRCVLTVFLQIYQTQVRQIRICRLFRSDRLSLPIRRNCLAGFSKTGWDRFLLQSVFNNLIAIDRLEHIWIKNVKNVLFLKKFNQLISPHFQSETKILLVDLASAEKITATIREDFLKMYFSTSIF